MTSDTARRAAHEAHFDALFSTDPDPWAYRTSAAERAKRRAVRASLGGRLARGLEIGCGNGESTADLAQAFLDLQAIDASPVAVSLARERVKHITGCKVAIARLPEDIPTGPFNAVIATEVLYYLPLVPLRRTLNAIREELTIGGRFVLTGSIRPFGDRDVSHGVLFREAARVFGPPRRTISGGAWRADLFVRSRRSGLMAW